MNTRILLVEDDERLAELTAEYLTKNDMEVSIEPRGDTAEARILAEQPDLVMLDVMLPGKDGFEVCRAVRSQYRGVILMLTARDEDFDQILGLEMGADDYIVSCSPASRPCCDVCPPPAMQTMANRKAWSSVSSRSASRPALRR